MPILDLDQRPRELGRIRLGDSRPGKSRDGRDIRIPRRLNEFRLTSSIREYLDAAAKLYGGTVEPWEEAKTEGDQWSLRTGTNVLDVRVPTMESLTSWWEMWDDGGCTRRCDGATNVLTDGPCECPAVKERLELSKKGKACKPTTRLSVAIPDLPDFGVWRVESHGVNAQRELGGTFALLGIVLGSRLKELLSSVPFQLRIESRTAKQGGETHHFVVPVLVLPQVSMSSLITGEVKAEVAAGSGTPALEVGGGEDAGAIGPDSATGIAPDYIAPDLVESFHQAWSRYGLTAPEVSEIVQVATKGRTNFVSKVLESELKVLQRLSREAVADRELSA